MGARFIGCDRDQVFLMPPSLRDWVPEGHLVWTVLDAVGELDLSAVYADYRDDGRGRPAYEPSMMVALLLYAYARGNRSSRGIERACVEDIAYRVVAGNLAPDHSTIAEFRCRHERPLGEVFSGVLGLCARAGLVSVGVVAIDGTKMAANASSDATATSARLRARSSPRLPRSTAAKTSSTATSAATNCPSSCARARGGARRCTRPRSALPANATTPAKGRLTTGHRRPSSSIRASS
jgi:transposase